jgi:Fic family protein
MLYVSLFFKTHRQRYYDLLNQVRLTGDWESWLDFFAQAVTETSNQAVETAQQLVRLSEMDRARINDLGRVAGSALRVHRALLQRPIASARWVSEQAQLSPATVNACLDHLERLQIVRELTGQRRNRLFSYTQYIEIMNQGTEGGQYCQQDAS